MKMRVRLPFINLSYNGSWRNLPFRIKLLFLAALAIPVAILSLGFSGGFGFPDAHNAEIAAALANVTTPPAGFWQGMWDGMILPITFAYSFFNEDVLFYSIHNTGWEYWVGFGMTSGTLAYNTIGGD